MLVYKYQEYLCLQAHNFKHKSLSPAENYLLPCQDHMISKAMKLILTGTTGFIGQEVLAQALSHPSITSIIALSRKPLPPTFASNPKLRLVLIDDFSTYSPSVLSQLSGADACIWYIYSSAQPLPFAFGQVELSSLSRDVLPYAETYRPQVHRSQIHRPNNNP
jgi:hypothetical protein